MSFLHLKGLRHRYLTFLLNCVYAGTNRFEKKHKILIKLGHEVGKGTKIVGPLFCTGHLKIGENCWIGKNFTVNGNGSVTIGDNCDVGPEVVFQTGGHEIGDASRRAGKGLFFSQTVGNGTWIGGRSTVLNNTAIGNSCVIAGCACVTKDVPDNTIVGGVPAKIIRSLENNDGIS